MDEIIYYKFFLWACIPSKYELIASDCLFFDDSIWIKIFNSSPLREKDAFAFWKKQKSQYPNLFIAAFQLLSIPTSSANIERIFSKSKQFLGDKQLKEGE